MQLSSIFDICFVKRYSNLEAKKNASSKKEMEMIKTQSL